VAVTVKTPTVKAAPLDVARIRKDFPILAQTMRGKPVPQVVEERAVGIDKRRQHTDDRPPLRCSWRNDQDWSQPDQHGNKG